MGAFDDEVSNQRANDGVLVGERSERTYRVNPRFELGGMESQYAASINSNSKTKTVQFSQNGYSEELIKTTQRVSAVQEEEVNELIEPLNLSGLGTHLLEGRGESSGPLGFEAFKLMRSRPNHNINAGKMIHDVSERRPTRSQAKRKRELVTRNHKSLRGAAVDRRSREGCSQANKSPETTGSIVNLATRSQTMKCKEPEVKRKEASNRRVLSKGVREDRIQVSDSVETTESLCKLAEESIELGELLGVKVIANRENAVKRITQSL